MDKRAMLMISGGIDSAVMAYKMKKDGWEIFGVHVNAGQPNHLQDRRAVNTVSIKLGVPIQIIDVPGLVKSFKGFLQPEYEEFNQAMCETTRPFLAVTSLCGVYADITGINTLAVGYLKEELDEFESRYANLNEVHNHFSEMISAGRKEKFRVLTPLMNASKTDVVEMAEELNVPIEATWSCWDVGPYHCGKCKGCLSRRSAFALTNITDPTKYGSDM